MSSGLTLADRLQQRSQQRLAPQPPVLPHFTKSCNQRDPEGLVTLSLGMSTRAVKSSHFSHLRVKVHVGQIPQITNPYVTGTGLVSIMGRTLNISTSAPIETTGSGLTMGYQYCGSVKRLLRSSYKGTLWVIHQLLSGVKKLYFTYHHLSFNYTLGLIAHMTYIVLLFYELTFFHRILYLC